MTVTNEVQSLTDVEVATLARFLTVLDDLGVQGKLAEELISSVRDAEVATRLVNTYVTDVTRTGVSDMHEAGVSLDAIVKVARETGIFPDDFLPTEETLRKCLERFWEAHRNSD